MKGTHTETGIVRAYPIPGRWLNSAACAGLPSELFYPRSASASRRDAKTASAVCADCPVAAECLDYALACEEIDPYGAHGSWAGLTSQERNTLRRQLKDAS